MIINKPYDVSCYGPNQKYRYVFHESRYDRRQSKENESNKSASTSQMSNTPATIEDAIPYLADALREPKLHLFTGLKRLISSDNSFSLLTDELIFRYLTGPIVLPASIASDKKIRRALCSTMNPTIDNDDDQCIYQILYD